MKTIGITTTVPVEILLAAGYKPVDLNNIFVSDPNPERLVNMAEKSGFPQNCCTWIKGIYGICLEHKMDTILCVTTGDCSNTIMLMEVLNLAGFRTIPFAYPGTPDIHRVGEALERLASDLGTTLESAEKVKEKLCVQRRLTAEMDELTWKENVVSGWENHLWLVSSSDFNGDYHNYEKQMEKFLPECRRRQPYPEDALRIGYIGVPPIFARDLYRFIEQQGAHVVYNEVQRQFSMPQPGQSLAEQYANYTYPYSVFGRLDDIRMELKRRKVDGVIHYVQAFCHRGIADIIMRKGIDLPTLTLEGNVDYILNSNARTRVEAFLDVLKRNRRTLSDRGQ